MTGKLQKNDEGQWVIWHRKDFDMCATDGGDIPINSGHSFWLLMFGEIGKEMNYVIQDGEAILKPMGPDTHEYVQD